MKRPDSPPVPERPGDAPAVLQQVGDGALHEHVDPECHRSLLQGPDHLQAGPVADVGQAGVAVAAEVPLADQAVRGAVEQGPPLLELPHPLGGLLGVQLGHAPVVEQLAAAHGVAEVDLPVVLGPQVAHGRGDAPFRHHRVRLAEQALADHGGPGARFVGSDGRPQAGAAGADHDHVVRVAFDIGHQIHPPCPRVPLAARRTYRSVKATKMRLAHASCMWRWLSLDTKPHILKRMGCLEKCLSRPPMMCRHEWHDSEYNHSRVALTRGRRCRARSGPTAGDGYRSPERRRR